MVSGVQQGNTSTILRSELYAENRRRKGQEVRNIVGCWIRHVEDLRDKRW